MSLKDIEKLKERVDKDPNSKLFVPLAEEYRKEGMVEEAIKVLHDGLERQPGYMSARVALGKIYLEKDMRKEAQQEFENVIKAIPDNLYAQKKLAEICRDSGQRDLAIKSYRTVLKLNAMDEDALNNLHELEDSGPEEQAAEEAIALEVLGEEPGGGEGALAEEVVSTGPSPEEHDAVTAPPVYDDLSAFKGSLFGEKGQDDEEEIVIIDEEAEEESDDMLEEEIGSAGEQTAPLDIYVPPKQEDYRPRGVTEDIMPEKFARTVNEEEMPAGPMAPEPVKAADAPFLSAETTKRDVEGIIRDADRMIAEGNYAGALNIYKRFLSDNPDEKKVRQRVEELRAFLKMTGKDKEALIERLDAFLAGVKKGRDGFFGST